MKVLKYVLCCISTISVVLSALLSISSVKAKETEQEKFIGSTLEELMEKFPDGKYWNHVGFKQNNPDGWTESPCKHHFKRCCSFVPGVCECNCFGGKNQC